MLITSKQNDIIKYANSIKEPKYVKKYGECLVESEKVVKELVGKGLISTILVDVEKLDKYNYILKSFTGKIYEINSNISKYLTDSITDSGIFGFVKINECKEVIGDKILVLDNLQDPSNLGAIIRSAMAFNFKSIIMLGGVYPYSAKVIRSSMSYVFNINIISYNYPQLVDFLEKNNYNLVCADMSGEDLKTFNAPKKLALVIGNEGNGVSPELRQLANSTVKVPMNNGVESLNASVSASIIMYKLGE